MTVCSRLKRRRKYKRIFSHGSNDHPILNKRWFSFLEGNWQNLAILNNVIMPNEHDNWKLRINLRQFMHE